MQRERKGMPYGIPFLFWICNEQEGYWSAERTIKLLASPTKSVQDELSTALRYSGCILHLNAAVRSVLFRPSRRRCWLVLSMSFLIFRAIAWFVKTLA
jgi:hypothetical protein